HAAILEAAGGVGPLELEPDLGPHPLGKPRGGDQRCRALVEGDNRVAVLQGQPLPVALDQGYGAQTNSSSITRIERGAPRRNSSVAIRSRAARNCDSGHSCMTITS